MSSIKVSKGVMVSYNGITKVSKILGISNKGIERGGIRS